jgi:hypothetical protein
MIGRTAGLGACLALSLAGVGAASVASSVSDGPRQGRPPADMRADAGTVAFRGTAADPRGGDPWVLRTHRTRADKRLCFEVGQQIPGKGFGREEKGGFRARDRGPDGGPAGSCVDLRTEPNPLLIITEFGAVTGDGGRTIVTGLLSDFTTVVVTGPGPEIRNLEPASDGTFLNVYEGEVHDKLRVDYLAAGGRRERKAF